MLKKNDKCDSEVFEKGRLIFVTYTISSKDIEMFVQLLSQRSGLKIDWSWFAGRAAVRALCKNDADFDKARQALKDLKPYHDELYFKTVKEKYGFGQSDEEIKRNCPSTDMFWL